jgi:hypothetical protein
MSTIPRSLKRPLKRGYILSIVQFGSSLRSSRPRDIDLAVVVKKGCYGAFLKSVGRTEKNLDIALIKEEETNDLQNFRWGNHGAHMVRSMGLGKALYGKNIFQHVPVSRRQLVDSIRSRLYGYIEEVRRAAFTTRVDPEIRRRWPKFLRLALFLIDADLSYPAVLGLTDAEVRTILKKHRIPLNTRDIRIGHETLWEQVLKKNEGDRAPRVSPSTRGIPARSRKVAGAPRRLPGPRRWRR